MMFFQSGALVFYFIAIFLLFFGFVFPGNGFVEYGAAFIIVGLILEFVSKYINKEHSGE